MSIFRCISPHFLNHVDHFMGVLHYCRQTIKSYILWIKTFIHFNKNQHPADMGSHGAKRFLTQRGVDIRTVQSQLGYADVKTTEIYTHILKQGIDCVKSPLSPILEK